MLSKHIPELSRIINRQDLTANEMQDFFLDILNEDDSGYWFVAFSAAAMTKKLNADELYGIVGALQKKAINISTSISPDKIIDISGSGGDSLKTFNVSTAAAFVIAGADVPVAKNCFKAITSLTGSSDLLEKVGVNMISNPAKISECLEKVGIVPLYFPNVFQKDVKVFQTTVQRIKAGLKIPSPMHLVGNLVEPIKMTNRIYGIYDERYLQDLPKVLQKLNYKRALIVRGVDGIDEISTIGKTKVFELNRNKIEEYILSPKDFGIPIAKYEDIRQISDEQNVIDFLRVIYNKDKGAKRDIIIANAGASLYIVGKAKNYKDGAELARQIIEEGRASKKLEQLIEFDGFNEKLEQWKNKINIK